MFAILIEADKIANALTGGHRDMTISARIGASIEHGCACRFARMLAAVLDCFESDHCRRAYRHHRELRKG